MSHKIAVKSKLNKKIGSQNFEFVPKIFGRVPGGKILVTLSVLLQKLSIVEKKTLWAKTLLYITPTVGEKIKENVSMFVNLYFGQSKQGCQYILFHFKVK